MIALSLAIGLLAALGLVSLRLMLGPTLYDRALAAHAMVLLAALAMAAFSVARGRGEGVDLAIALVIGDLVLAIAALKFFRQRSFQAPMARAGGGEP